ncbi:hypothetical protein DEU56DRAFT_66535 [Suillus clintonianus]|uniref:uncharacterized protein n=1 Tax=Suillus clintonianus TaxID=1904413 RepID=UPI001B86E307|nr:uncharacterized protein DEU56DRAFT_66535 [Suillus clintonianus]KAG2123089.1 hypothetical protein DEU56DRAFT_66535 [Suillus clintonianus]
MALDCTSPRLQFDSPLFKQLKGLDTRQWLISGRGWHAIKDRDVVMHVRSLYQLPDSAVNRSAIQVFAMRSKTHERPGFDQANRLTPSTYSMHLNQGNGYRNSSIALIQTMLMVHSLVWTASPFWLLQWLSVSNIKHSGLLGLNIIWTLFQALTGLPTYRNHCFGCLLIDALCLNLQCLPKADQKVPMEVPDFGPIFTFRSPTPQLQHSYDMRTDADRCGRIFIRRLAPGLPIPQF